jgi:hypothetical protein
MESDMNERAWITVSKKEKKRGAVRRPTEPTDQVPENRKSSFWYKGTTLSEWDPIQ